MSENNMIGYGMLTFLSIILFVPFATWMNTNLPSDSVGLAISSFFWIVYAILVIVMIYKTLYSALIG
jgi:hypothetical protein